MGYSWFLLELNPLPWRAPEFGTGRRNGKGYVQAYKSEELRTYQNAVKEEFTARYPETEQIGGPIDLHFLFWRQLPDYLSVNEKRVRTHRADATNMQKALEDALQGVLFANDREVKRITSEIVEQDFETEPHILIGIRTHVPTDLPSGIHTIVAQGKVDDRFATAKELF